MKQIHLFILLALLLSSCENKVEKRVSAEERYIQEAKCFLETVYFSEFKEKALLLAEPKFNYTDKAINFRYFSALDQFQIKNQIDYPKIKKWRNVLPLKINYISLDTARMAFRDLHCFGCWKYLYPDIENGVKAISVPVFYMIILIVFFIQTLLMLD